jgi:hypothetical protein
MEDKPYLTPIRSALPVLAAVEGIYTSASTKHATELDTAILKESQ